MLLAATDAATKTHSTKGVFFSCSQKFGKIPLKTFLMKLVGLTPSSFLEISNLTCIFYEVGEKPQTRRDFR